MGVVCVVVAVLDNIPLLAVRHKVVVHILVVIDRLLVPLVLVPLLVVVERRLLVLKAQILQVPAEEVQYILALELVQVVEEGHILAPVLVEIL